MLATGSVGASQWLNNENLDLRARRADVANPGANIGVNQGIALMKSFQMHPKRRQIKLHHSYQLSNTYSEAA